jgi:hypothetical protein
VVIDRSEYFFSKLEPNLIKFHPERNVLAMAVICTNGRKYRSVKIIIVQVYFVQYEY